MFSPSWVYSTQKPIQIQEQQKESSPAFFLCTFEMRWKRPFWHETDTEGFHLVSKIILPNPTYEIKHLHH
jgi:hypothetical protein